MENTVVRVLSLKRTKVCIQLETKLKNLSTTFIRLKLLKKMISIILKIKKGDMLFKGNNLPSWI